MGKSHYGAHGLYKPRMPSYKIHFMPNILEIIHSKAKEKAVKIAKNYAIDQAFGGLEEAKVFDDQQKGAILEIAGTQGFKVIMDYEASIIEACLQIIGDRTLSDEKRKEAQREYAIAKDKYSFLKNLSDPSKK